MIGKHSVHMMLLLCLITVQSLIFSTDAQANWPVDRIMNPLHAVIVFTKFKGEAPGDSLAPYWADSIFDGKEGSVPHFFDKVSFGTYQITGKHLPKRYELPEKAEYYVNNRGTYSRDVLDILSADPEINFSMFDNDGPDGIPGSSDDDHFVDYLILMPMSRPYGFIFKSATGFWTLSLKETYSTSDQSSDGFNTKIDTFSGCIATANFRGAAIGTIVSEISHALGSGALDLMDKEWNDTDPSVDSAGVGYWDFLGKGALGWEGKNGPIGPSAFNRMRLDSVGQHNVNLIPLSGFQENIVIKDVGKEDGVIYQIPITQTEYFLIEYRRNDGLYYDRHIPQNGLLIWHVLYAETNNNEQRKLCDLECPDGRYLDAGYPLGKKPDPIRGGDNLDFWAHDNSYAIRHAGNAGDSFDVFDGIRYTQFGTDTNPNSYSKVTEKKTGIEIFNIRPEGDTMVFDCIIPPFHNWFEEKYPFIGAAYHRFAETGVGGAAKPADEGIYLIRTNGAMKPSTLLTVSEKECKIESLAMVAGYEIDGLLLNRLITTDEHLRGSRLTRRNMTIDDFSGVIAGFGLTPEEVGDGSVPTLVQKVSRVSNDTSRPTFITLYQNFPNPFNASTTIQYLLPSADRVSLEVYNLAGQRVYNIDQGYQSMGLHALELELGNLASGVYLYRLKGMAMSPAKRFTLVK